MGTCPSDSCYSSAFSSFWGKKNGGGGGEGMEVGGEMEKLQKEIFAKRSVLLNGLERTNFFVDSALQVISLSSLLPFSFFFFSFLLFLSLNSHFLIFF